MFIVETIYHPTYNHEYYSFSITRYGDLLYGWRIEHSNKAIIYSAKLYIKGEFISDIENPCDFSFAQILCYYPAFPLTISDYSCIILRLYGENLYKSRLYAKFGVYKTRTMYHNHNSITHHIDYKNRVKEILYPENNTILISTNIANLILRIPLSYNITGIIINDNPLYALIDEDVIYIYNKLNEGDNVRIICNANIDKIEIEYDKYGIIKIN